MRDQDITVLSKVSIVVPVYNTVEFLDVCLESIIHQTYNNIEIIIINDASTDSSPEIISRYAHADPRIKVITNSRNRGLSIARNLGVRAADGDYIMFIDSDDFIDLDLVSIALHKLLETNSEIVEFAYYRPIGKDKLVRPEFATKSSTHAGIDCLRNYLDHKKPLITKGLAWNKLYKLSIFDSIEFPPGRIFEDAHLMPEIYASTRKITFIPDALYFYRIREGSIMSSPVTQKWINDTASYLLRTFNYVGSLGVNLSPELCDHIYNMSRLTYERSYNERSSVDFKEIQEVLRKCLNKYGDVLELGNINTLINRMKNYRV